MVVNLMCAARFLLCRNIDPTSVASNLSKLDINCSQVRSSLNRQDIKISLVSEQDRIVNWLQK